MDMIDTQRECVHACAVLRRDRLPCTIAPKTADGLVCVELQGARTDDYIVRVPRLVARRREKSDSVDCGDSIGMSETSLLIRTKYTANR